MPFLLIVFLFFKTLKWIPSFLLLRRDLRQWSSMPSQLERWNICQAWIVRSPTVLKQPRGARKPNERRRKHRKRCAGLCKMSHFLVRCWGEGMAKMMTTEREQMMMSVFCRFRELWFVDVEVLSREMTEVISELSSIATIISWMFVRSNATLIGNNWRMTSPPHRDQLSPLVAAAVSISKNCEALFDIADSKNSDTMTKPFLHMILHSPSFKTNANVRKSLDPYHIPNHWQVFLLIW